MQRRASLVEVASATGISKSFLSLVENDRSDITIGRLLRLVNYYGADMADLFPQGEPQDPIIVKRDEQREVLSPKEGIRVFLLAPKVERTMNPSLGVIEPGGASAEKASHVGEEFLHMLEGIARTVVRRRRSDRARTRRQRLLQGRAPPFVPERRRENRAFHHCLIAADHGEIGEPWIAEARTKL